MADNEPQIAYLLIESGKLQSIAFSEGEAMANRSSDEIEIAEWPVKPLRQLPGGMYEYATEHIATDTADLGKLTSIDTLMEIAFTVRGREGWKCINVLPGLFGEKCFPPGVTVVWGRERARLLHHPWSADYWKQQLDALDVKPVSRFTVGAPRGGYYRGLFPEEIAAMTDEEKAAFKAAQADPIGPDPAGETA